MRVCAARCSSGPHAGLRSNACPPSPPGGAGPSISTPPTKARSCRGGATRTRSGDHVSVGGLRLGAARPAVPAMITTWVDWDEPVWSAQGVVPGVEQAQRGLRAGPVAAAAGRSAHAGDPTGVSGAGGALPAAVAGAGARSAAGPRGDRGDLDARRRRGAAPCTTRPPRRWAGVRRRAAGPPRGSAAGAVDAAPQYGVESSPGRGDLTWHSVSPGRASGLAQLALTLSSSTSGGISLSPPGPTFSRTVAICLRRRLTICKAPAGVWTRRRIFIARLWRS